MVGYTEELPFGFRWWTARGGRKDVMSAGQNLQRTQNLIEISSHEHHQGPFPFLSELE